MARARNEAPPGGDEQGIFKNPPGQTDGPDEASRQKIDEIAEKIKALEPKPEGRRTTRGMLPELKVIHEVYGLLAELDEPQRRFVLDFINGKFPKPQVPA